MDLRLTFNTESEKYNRLRPYYNHNFLSHATTYASINDKSKVLEVGIGAGQATQPFLDSKCQLTAIELGDKLSEICREKFKAYNINVINAAFEEVSLETNYDLIYSASAFHWIDLDQGLTKVKKYLNPGGSFAWMSIQSTPATEHLHIYDAIQNVYEKYGDYFVRVNSEKFPEAGIKIVNQKQAYRRKSLESYGFVDIKEVLDYSSRTFTAGEYIELISTYSDHRSLEDKVRIPFLQEVESTIQEMGGSFTLSYTMLMCMGRKEN